MAFQTAFEAFQAIWKPKNSNFQNPFAAPDAGRAGTHRFQNQRLANGFQEGIEFVGRAGYFDGIALVGNINHLAAVNTGQAQDFVAKKVGIM